MKYLTFFGLTVTLILLSVPSEIVSINGDTGTDKDLQTGTDKDLQTGTDKDLQTGTDKDLQTGTDKDLQTGTDKDLQTGTDKDLQTGTDKDLQTGTDKDLQTGTDKDQISSPLIISWIVATAAIFGLIINAFNLKRESNREKYGIFSEIYAEYGRISKSLPNEKTPNYTEEFKIYKKSIIGFYEKLAFMSNHGLVDEKIVSVFSNKFQKARKYMDDLNIKSDEIEKWIKSNSAIKK